ncbi:MAG: hypothetical protein ACOYBY_02730 [Dermatophilaceae bacterium]
MDDKASLPKPTPEVIETLRLAEKVAADPASRHQFRLLLELLRQPTLPTVREAAARFAGEGKMTLSAGPAAVAWSGGVAHLTLSSAVLADGAVATDELTVAKFTWNPDAEQKTVDYAALIMKLSATAYAVGQALQQAANVVQAWRTALGR